MRSRRDRPHRGAQHHERRADTRNVKRVIDGVLDWVFPPRCPACDEDIDGDGRIDVVSANAATPGVSFAAGDGAGGIAPIGTVQLDGFPLAIDLGDLDGDGDLDAVASDFTNGAFVLFENPGGRLVRHPIALAAGTAASCAILHDRDNDGDLDITGIDEIDDLIFLFENAP